MTPLLKLSLGALATTSVTATAGIVYINREKIFGVTPSSQAPNAPAPNNGVVGAGDQVQEGQSDQRPDNATPESSSTLQVSDQGTDSSRSRDTNQLQDSEPRNQAREGDVSNPASTVTGNSSPSDEPSTTINSHSKVDSGLSSGSSSPSAAGDRTNTQDNAGDSGGTDQQPQSPASNTQDSNSQGSQSQSTQ